MDACSGVPQRRAREHICSLIRQLADVADLGRLRVSTATCVVFRRFRYGGVCRGSRRVIFFLFVSPTLNVIGIRDFAIPVRKWSLFRFMFGGSSISTLSTDAIFVVIEQHAGWFGFGCRGVPLDTAFVARRTARVDSFTRGRGLEPCDRMTLVCCVVTVLVFRSVAFMFVCACYHETREAFCRRVRYRYASNGMLQGNITRQRHRS